MRTSSEGKQHKCMKKLLRLHGKGYAAEVQLEGDGGEAGETVRAGAQVDGREGESHILRFRQYMHLQNGDNAAADVAALIAETF